MITLILLAWFCIGGICIVFLRHYLISLHSSNVFLSFCPRQDKFSLELVAFLAPYLHVPFEDN